MNESYEYCYQCPKCKKLVSATKKRCSCGEFLDNLTPVRRLIPAEEAKKEQAVYLGDNETGQGSETPYQGLWQKPDAFYADEDEDWGAVETDPIPEEEDEEEEMPLFYLNACRYDNGTPIPSNKVNIAIHAKGEQKFLLGRHFFVGTPDLFFPAGNKEIDERYKCISRNNALLYIEDGRLYIQIYQEDGARKSTVYIGQTKLEPGSAVELHHGDKVRFGGTKSIHNGTVDIFIVSAEEKDRYMAGAGVREVVGVVGELMAKVSSMEGDLNSMKQVIAQINPADLQIRRGEDAEAYEKRLSETIPQVELKTKEDYVERFLAAVTKKDSEKYKKQMAFFKENDTRFHLVYQAAFFEDACVEKGLEDYAGPMSFLGKAIEGFVMGEIADTAKTFHKDAYELLCAQKGNRIKLINQYDILELFKTSDQVKKIVKAAGYVKEPERSEMPKQVANAVKILNEVRTARNTASHCGPDTGSTGSGAVDAITKERYEMIKKNLLGSDTIEVMHQLYLRTKKEGRA